MYLIFGFLYVECDNFNSQSIEFLSVFMSCDLGWFES